MAFRSGSINRYWCPQPSGSLARCFLVEKPIPKALTKGASIVSDDSGANRGALACPRCRTLMNEVANIAPVAGAPGLTAHECPKCGYVTSVLQHPATDFSGHFRSLAALPVSLSSPWLNAIHRKFGGTCSPARSGDRIAGSLQRVMDAIGTTRRHRGCGQRPCIVLLLFNAERGARRH